MPKRKAVPFSYRASSLSSHSFGFGPVRGANSINFHSSVATNDKSSFAMIIQPVVNWNVTGEQPYVRPGWMFPRVFTPLTQTRTLTYSPVLVLYEFTIDNCLRLCFVCWCRPRTLRWSGRTPLRTFCSVREGQCISQPEQQAHKSQIVQRVGCDPVHRTGRLIWYRSFEIKCVPVVFFSERNVQLSH